MEITALAQHAVSVVARHLAGQGQADTVHALLSDRLGRTALGTAVLNQLRERPLDADRQQVVATAVAEQAEADPQFAEMLRWSVGWVAQPGVPGQVERHSRVRRRTVGWIVVAVLLVVGGIVTGVVIGGSDDEPDPMSIGTDPGEAGMRQTAEAVRDAYSDRDADLLCALSYRLDSGDIRGGNTTGKAVTPAECPQELRERFTKLPPAYTEQSRTLAVEWVGQDGDADERFSLSISGDDEAGVLLVNRDPEAVCQSWELLLARQNGRWVVNLTTLIDGYVDPGVPGRYDCDAS